MTVKFIFNDTDSDASSVLDGDDAEILNKLSPEIGWDAGLVLLTLHHVLRGRGEYREGRLVCDIERDRFNRVFDFVSPKTLRYCLITLRNRKLLYMTERDDKVLYRLMYKAIKELIG